MLIITLCNSFLYYTYFSFSIIKAKIEAADKIGNAECIRVRVAALQKDESGEAWYNNKLYDVAKRESVKDTEWVYLMRDEEEQNMLAQTSDFFQNDWSGFLEGKTSLQKKALHINYEDYLLSYSGRLQLTICLNVPPISGYKLDYFSIGTDLPSPPPKGT